MANKKKIIISGVTADSFSLFAELYYFLSNLNMEVVFVEPEYSGAILLDKNKIPFIELDIGKSEKIYDYNIKLIDYELRKNNFEEIKILRQLKKVYIIKEGKTLYLKYASFFRKNKFNLLLVWGGFSMHTQIPITFAKKNGVKVIFIEKGLFPKTLQVDLKGVNGLSSLKEILGTKLNNVTLSKSNGNFYKRLMTTKWSFRYPLTTLKLKEKTFFLLKKKEYLLLLIKILDNLLVSKFSNTVNYKEIQKVTDPVSNNETINDNNYIFIPFQVSDDTQLLVQKTFVNNNIALVQMVNQCLNELNISTKIYIKFHPREYRKLDITKLKQYNNIVFSKAGTIDLISKSKVVITINSTVGFEALVMEKPVVIFGSSLYENLPNVYKINEYEKLKETLKAILPGKIQLKNNENQFWIEEVYRQHVICDYIEPSKNDVMSLWLKIKQLANI